MESRASLLEVRPLARVLKALSDETRLRIVALLCHGELCVCHIEAILGLPQSTTSRQLGTLRAAGIVESRRQGTWMHYRLAQQLDTDCQRVVEALIQAFAGKTHLHRSNTRDTGDTSMNTVIFACVHNAGRSQMSAAFFNAIADASKARAISAGTAPGERVHPVVVEAMREVGIDLSAARPQKLTEELARPAQLLVTMGCGDECPYVPGLKIIDWPLPDPKGQSIEAVREIRDDVRSRILELIRAQGWSAGPASGALASDAGFFSALLASDGETSPVRAGAHPAAEPDAPEQ